ncbi:riboflavin synthase [Actinocatenispora rupis]|uniref:Riboflavin synthase n=1 Tax=Actinocatenispora rupis TaxID=519421 RepID=A0A8J3N9A7_9ACTN|nr:riboflavin synthase [Actinocatenispora rupis]GID11134.1 riboflavin synthase subunit alpha [Actinocatenispora rupis]
MFTGIIEELGEVTAIERSADSALITVRGPLVAGDARDGDSIAVNGVCLTVVSTDPATGTFVADVMRETLERSTVDSVRVGDPVNLERAATLATRLGGHLVQGHVDGVGTILSRHPGDRWEDVRVALPPDLNRYVVEKGSIAVDGVSLTVTAVDEASFSVSLIPTTMRVTTLGHRPVGDLVNLEVDVIGKHLEKLVGAPERAS